MINFTKQELEYFNPIVYTEFYQEYLTLLTDFIYKCLSVLNKEK